MENQFVPYELAVKLKELGFDKPCLALYKRDGSELATLDYIDYEGLKGSKNSELTGYWYNTTAPLWQQAFDWFRYKKGFESFIRFTQGYGNKSHSYHICDVFRVSGKSIYLSEGKTYEEARQACLEELIKLTKTFNNDNIRSIKT